MRELADHQRVVTLRALSRAADAPRIVALGQSMFGESRFARLGFDRDLADSYAARITADPLCIGFGAFDGEDLVGMAVGACGATLPFSRALVAHEHLLYIAPTHREPWLASRLIRAFIEEAERRGARDIVFSNGTGYQPERVGKLFQLCGLTHVGGLYVKEI